MARAISYALLLSAVLALLNFLTLRWAAAKSQKVFMTILFGGMVLRLLLLGAAVLVVWKFTALER